MDAFEVLGLALFAVKNMYRVTVELLSINNCPMEFSRVCRLVPAPATYIPQIVGLRFGAGTNCVP